MAGEILKMIDVTELGLIFIPLGGLAFLLRREWLIWIVVATAPLFYVKVAHIELFNFNLEFSLYFALLFMLDWFIELLRGKRELKLFTGNKWLLASVAAGILSLIMPLYFARGEMVHPIDSGYHQYKWVELSFQAINVTQLTYFVFYVLFTIVLANELSRKKEWLKKVLQLQVWVSIPIILSGYLVQAACLADNLESIKWVFDSFGAPHLYCLWLGPAKFPRMYTLVGEAGYTGAYLLIPLGILLGGLLYPQLELIRSRLLNWLLFLFVLVGIVISTGTTGIGGLGFLGLGTLLLLWRRSELNKLKDYLLPFLGIATAVALLSGVVIALFTDVSPLKVLTEWAIPKLTFQGRATGWVRRKYSIDAIKLFLKYPLLGVGFGSNKVSTLGAGLLSTFGLLGTIPFIYNHIKVFRRLAKRFHTALTEDLPGYAFIFMITLFSVGLALLLGKSILALSFLWYWVLLAAAGGFLLYAKQQD